MGRKGITSMNLDASQTAAVTRACTSRFSIVTGTAGSGKSTIIKSMTNRLESEGETVNLCAFAGKAAARLREACSHPASTIHRMLGYQGSKFMLEDLDGITVIVDEASMVDSMLLAEITRRNPKRLVLVGDPAQLPPVGRAQPFHDLIVLRPDLVSSLTTCYRASEAVFQSATIIRGGGRPPMSARSDGEKWTMQNTGSPKQTQALILKWIKAGAFDFEQDVILVARNGDEDEPCTVRGLNAAIVDLVSPRDEKVKFVKGDRVICTKNIPDLDCWNGTTGTVHAIDHDGGVWVRTDIPVIDRRKTKDERDPVYTNHVLFGKDHKGKLQLAYALSTHKSQGSQYRRVLVACFRRDLNSILDRSLLYTAVTRTKSACVVVGEMAAVWGAIDKRNFKSTVMQQIGG